MAERPEDLNLPNAVVTRIIKDAVCILFTCSKKKNSWSVNLIHTYINFENFNLYLMFNKLFIIFFATTSFSTIKPNMDESRQLVRH